MQIQLFDDGRIVLGYDVLVRDEDLDMGTPMELYEKSENKFVAGFIGSPSMNIVDAKISADGGAVEFADDVDLNLQANLPGLAGQPVTVGLRPEHLQEGDPAESHLKCTARLVEHLGADTLVHGPLGREGVDIAVRLSGFRMIESGQVLALSAAPEQIHLFDRGNGKRIQLV